MTSAKRVAIERPVSWGGVGMGAMMRRGTKLSLRQMNNRTQA